VVIRHELGFYGIRHSNRLDFHFYIYTQNSFFKAVSFSFQTLRFLPVIHSHSTFDPTDCGNSSKHLQWPGSLWLLLTKHHLNQTPSFSVLLFKHCNTHAITPLHMWTCFHVDPSITAYSAIEKVKSTVIQEQNSTDNAIQEHCQNIQEIPVDSHRSHDDGKSTLQKRRVDRRQYFCARFHSRLLSRTHARTHDTSYNTPSMSLFEKKNIPDFHPCQGMPGRLDMQLRHLRHAFSFTRHD